MNNSIPKQEIDTIAERPGKKRLTAIHGLVVLVCIVVVSAVCVGVHVEQLRMSVVVDRGILQDVSYASSCHCRHRIVLGTHVWDEVAGVFNMSEILCFRGQVIVIQLRPLDTGGYMLLDYYQPR